MSIKVALEHRTSYAFDRLVTGAAARRAAAPGAALTHADRGLFAARRAGRTLRQLAAGRGGQLPGPPGVSQPDAPADHHGRTHRRPQGDQPVRLLHRGLGRDLAGRRAELSQGAGRRPQAIPAAGRRRGRRVGSGRPGTGLGAQLLGAAGHPHHRLPGQPQPRGQRRRRLQPADGTRCPDTGLHAAHRHRLLPGLRVAVGVDPAPAGAGRPVRVRLPGAAGIRRRGAGRAVGARRRLHRPARLDRGLHPGCGLDRAGPDLGTVRRGGPHPAGGDAAPRERGTHQRRHRRVRNGAGIFQHRHSRPRRSARHAALHGCGVGDDPRGRPSGR